MTWTDRNDININMYYIELLLKYFSINKWKCVLNVDNGNDLLISKRQCKYKIKLQKDECTLKLYEINKLTQNENNFQGEDCWYNLLKFINS